MKILAIVVCLFLLVFVVWTAPAQEVTRTASQSITLGSGPCIAQAVLSKVKPEYREKLTRGHGIWFDRKTYELCWLREDGKIFVIWEDGTFQGFLASVFEGGA